jgi:hypothetical protein
VIGCRKQYFLSASDLSRFLSRDKGTAGGDGLPLFKIVFAISSKITAFTAEE